MSTKFLQNRQKDQDMRNALAKDLRKEHFNFGFEQGMPKESKYAESMKEYPLDQFGSTNKEMKALRKDLRSEHYILGLDKDPNLLYQTSAANAFTNYNNPERSKLSQETKNDLRSCHFVLGHDKKTKESDYKLNYKDKPINPEVYKDRKDQVVQLRQHHKVFNDTNDYNSSQYNETMNKNYDQSFLKQGKTKDQIRDQIVELRKTNLVMGSNNAKYGSENKDEFSDKGYARNDLLDIDLRSHSYRLGVDENSYVTTAGSTFKGVFQKPDAGKTKELMKDLRSEHYELGNDKMDYKSENARTYKQFQKDELADKPDLSALYKSHFVLGGPSSNISTDERYTSKYNTDFIQKNRIDNKSLRDDRSDRRSNIQFGSDVNKEQFISEQAKNMKNFSKDNERGVLDPNLAKDLRGTHYNFGTDQNNYVSHNKDTYEDKSKQVQSSKLEEELKRDLRRNHFEYGTQKTPFQPMQKDIGQNQGPPSKLDPTLAKQLRSHHFNHGIYNVDYTTTYQKHHLDFTKD